MIQFLNDPGTYGEILPNELDYTIQLDPPKIVQHFLPSFPVLHLEEDVHNEFVVPECKSLIFTPNTPIRIQRLQLKLDKLQSEIMKI